MTPVKLVTSRFGEIDVLEDSSISFPSGMPGFEQMRQFALIHADEGIPFTFLQSLEDGDLAFIVTDPFLFFEDYQFDLADKLKSELEIINEEDVMVFSIVSVQANDIMTLNLLAPVVINMKKRIGKQIILHESPYKTKHVLSLSKEPIDKGV